MRLAESQRGMGFLGWVFVLGLIGFAALLTMKLVPVYSDRMSMQRALQEVASNPENTNKSVFEIRKTLQRFWDIDYIDTVQPQDIDVVRQKNGRRVLAYDYEARVHLFYNFDLVVSFKGEVPMVQSSE